MSQQINLFLPELQPRRDWLALHWVTGAALLGIAAMFAAWGWLRWQASDLQQREARLQGEVKAMQELVQQKVAQLAARKPDAALLVTIANTRAELGQREEALRLIESGAAGGDEGHAGTLRAFSQQALNGVWLTAFTLHRQEMEIRGRLSDPGLLPAYIRKLNGEAVFKGRRFAELDIRRNDLPRVESGTVAREPSAPQRSPYVDFALRGEAEPIGEKTK